MFNVPSDLSRHYDTLLYRSSAVPRISGTESRAQVGWPDRAVIIVQSSQLSDVCFWPVAAVSKGRYGPGRSGPQAPTAAVEESGKVGVGHFEKIR